MTQAYALFVDYQKAAIQAIAGTKQIKVLARTDLEFSPDMKFI